MYSFLGDEPYGGPSDPLGFDAYAGELRNLILASQGSTPLILGIEAPWGMGKSSLMGQLVRALEAQPPARRGAWWRIGSTPGTPQDHPDVRIVQYNAWTAEGADVQEGLVKSVLEAVDSRVLSRALRKKRLMGAARISLLLVAGWLRLGGLVDAAWNRLSVDARTRNEIQGVVQTAMAAWLQERGRPTLPRDGRHPLVVVFVDDLDRCSPPNVIKIFEAVKVYLQAPRLVFIFGYDENVVSRAVLEEAKFSEAVTSREYLEKIIQVTFRIPRPSLDQAYGLLRNSTDASGTTELFGEVERQLIVERNAINPRRIKRFINAFVVDHSLDELAGRMRPELLIKVLILEMYFPEFAQALASDGPGGVDGIEEFLTYSRARRAIRRGEDEECIKRVLDWYELQTAPTSDEMLGRLDQATRPAFVPLADNREFLALIESSAVESERTAMLEKIQRRRAQLVLMLRRASVKQTRFEGNLRGAQLEEATLSEIDVRDTDMQDSDATRSTISKLQASGADLRRLVATQASISDADFTEANVDEADFSGSSLSYVVFSGARANDTHFDSASIREIRCDGARLAGASFANANIDRAVFTAADLRSASFAQARLLEVKFDRAALRGATFREAIVERGEFATADLRDIDFRRARVRTADFGGADLTGASFTDTELEDVDLSTAIGLAQEAIAGARLRNVQLPSFD